ncbi:hypothetical protein [Chryseobacterium potabilaquae]|uniref:Uncharacterized protein n=1 Tax=Chryseobacterium potabilaquae TaxID=2675057 RepID=A0A6N4X8W7_9FLAO|nr:hypothetical protein [Chryseobacterium potabilaquae]CAA7195424.1 hypothetical protein CHRY9293_01623 [Chryseobacterium potabilaquae]
MENQKKDLVLANLNEMPNLHEAAESPRELTSEYWTPEKEGEYKVGVIIDLRDEPCLTEEGETIMLPCIVMISQRQDKSFETIRNGSKRLVAAIESALDGGEVVMGQTPVKVSFVGKKKNKSNSYSSDRWSVRSIII